MQITTMGLVLRATKTGESDRVLSILTPQHGVISAIAKGSLRLKSKLLSATGLFCYTEFTLFEGKTMYVVDEADVREVFFGLHEDIEAMALAMYLAEFTATLSPTGEEAEKQLRLLLNTLYLLGRRKRAPRLLKAAFELRTLCQSGYLPDFVACAECLCYNAPAFYFDSDNARILCEDCAEKQEKKCNLDAAALNAMRHIAYSDDNVLFNFILAEGSLAQMSAAVERYALICLDKPMRSLDFLKTVLP
ncbi:MAG: DNA repair protein RecO [Ruthenibacterium sp.]